MDDQQILNNLIKKSGGVKQAADAMKVSRQSIWEWRNGFSDTARIRIFLYAEEIGMRLPKDFLRRAVA